MSDLMENKATSEAGEVYSDVKNWLVSYGINEKDAVKISSMVTSFSIEYAKKEMSVDLGKMDFLTKVGRIGLSGVINVIEEGSLIKSVAMTMASAFVEDFAGAAATTLIAGLGSSAVVAVGAGVVAGVAAGFAVDYLVDVTWDYFIGPGAQIDKNDALQKYNFTVYGKLSDFLLPRDGWLANHGLADNVWQEYDLAHANEWRLSSADTTEPLEIFFNGQDGANIFEFNGISSSSLRDIYDSSEEHKKVIDLILQNHGRDFEASVNGPVANYIHNYAARDRQTIEDAVLSGSGAEQQRSILALDYLLSFIEEGVDDYAGINATEYLNEHSAQFIQDRAAFLYYTMHENTTAIRFKDLELNAYVPQPTGTEFISEYTWGRVISDGLTGSDNIDHLYGMGGDDILRGLGGMDYLEGGAGNDEIYGNEQDDILEGGFGSDTMYGGAGEDRFILHGTDPDEKAFDTFYGEAGTDTILGGALNDTIRVNSLSLSGNSIEIIDGGGGINVIAGTEGDNTIDLTGMDVQHIARIEGGALFS